MKSKIVWSFAISISCLGTSATHSADADKSRYAELERMLSERGVSLQDYRYLRSQNIVSASLESRPQTCGMGDPFSINEKFLISDNVVRGRISKIEYLYKEGGPFRTLYTVETREALKGGAKEEFKVLSEFGPNRRDHRRWKRDPSGISLEVGDEGIFFLSRQWIKKFSEKYPDKESLLAGKFLFQNGLAGVYLIKGEEFDTAFLEASEKTKTTPVLMKTLSDIKALKRILEKEQGK